MRPRRPDSLLRLEPSSVAAFQFLQLNHYPFFWSPDRLSKALLCQVMDNDGRQLGLVWGEWTDTGVLTIHACAAKGQRLPFFSTNVFARLCDMAFFVGADEITTSITMHKTPGPIRRLLLRLGFAEGGDHFTLNLWSLYGQQHSAVPGERSDRPGDE